MTLFIYFDFGFPSHLLHCSLSLSMLFGSHTLVTPPSLIIFLRIEKHNLRWAGTTSSEGDIWLVL